MDTPAMLKSILNIKHNINIETYTKLIAFLKRTKDGYVPKKSKTLEIEEIEKFIKEAPNETYLMMKVSIFILLYSLDFKDPVLGSFDYRHVCSVPQT